MTNSEYPAAYIDDGYTEAGYIAGLTRMWPPVRFQFRPFTPDEEAQFFDQIKGHMELKSRHIQAEWLAKKIVNWDIERGPRKGLVQINAANLLRVKPGLFCRLFEICRGILPCDADPEAIVEAEDTDGADAKN